MPFALDHDLHIHSILSRCCKDPEQTTERILQYAKDFNLKTICITDHFWDETVPGASQWYQLQPYAHITQSLPLPQAEGIRFLFGCETDMFKDMTVGLAKEHYDRFDFVNIPINHFHMKKESLPEEYQQSPQKRAEFWTMKFEALLDMDLPFHKIGLAHLTSILIDMQNHLAALQAIKQEDLDRLFAKAAKLGCGIELNADDFYFEEGTELAEAILRIFRTAKKAGCKFFCGSDAHDPQALNAARARFEKAVRCLNLTEKDQFKI